MHRAIWNGQVIAESPSTVTFGGHEYFPQESVDWDFVHDADHQSLSLKGKAHYYMIEVDGSRAADAAWHYPKPTPLARKVKGYVGFGADVKIVDR